MTDPGDPDELTHLPTERLEAEALALAGHVAAGTCSFLLVVGELDRRDVATSWECLSTAHWLSWKCGIGMVAAREQVRVARALRDLPVVTRAFARGALSYSKVRALTRVCHPTTEAELVDLALHATASQVERMCRALRRADDLAEAGCALDDAATAAHARRSCSWRRDDDGSVVLTARLPPEAAELVTGALAELTERPDPDQPEELEARRADALVELARRHRAHDPDDTTLRRPPRPEIVVHVDLTAGGLSGVGLARHDDRTIDPVPDALQPDAPPGATAGGPERPAAAPSDRWPLRTAGGRPLGPAAWERLACDAGIRMLVHRPDGTTLDLGRHQRTVSERLYRALLARDGCCRFPGCNRRWGLDAHHIVWWSRGGRTDMDNLLLLCPKHHHAIHDRDWQLTGNATDHTFTAPAGHCVERTPPTLSGAAAHLVAAHERHGRDVCVDHPGGRWSGDHIDWDCFFAAIWSRTQPAGVTLTGAEPGASAGA